MNENQIVKIDEDGLKLFTGLSSRQFANAKLGQHIIDAGIFLIPEADGTFSTKDFRFTDAKEYLENNLENIAVEVKPFSGKTLYSVLTGQESQDKKLYTIERLVAAVEWSFRNGIEIPNCGPLGTIITEDNKFLLLPFAIFERTMHSQQNDATSEFYGCWINGALNPVDAWRFTLSAYTYFVITGKNPYAELDREKRTQDYFDNNFIPLDLCISVQNEESKILVEQVNHNLSLTQTAHEVIQPLKQKKGVKRVAEKILENKNNDRAHSSPLPQKFNFMSTKINDEEREANKEKFIEKQMKDLSRKRFLRRYRTVILASIASFVLVCVVVGSIIKTNMDKPTTEGLDPLQVVQTLYNSISTLDSIALDSCGDSKAIKSYSNMVSSIYVTSKMREAYEQQIPSVTPAQWLNFDNPLKVAVFGTSQLAIQTNDSWTEEPQKGDTVSFTADFYLIISTGSENIEVSSCTDELTLTYGKKSWQITELNSVQIPIEVSLNDIKQDVTKARSTIKSDESISIKMQGHELSKNLSDTYFWMPSKEETQIAAETMPEYYLVQQNSNMF